MRPKLGRHNATFKIPHDGHGLLPAGCEKKPDFNGWTPHYGWYNGCYWEVTTKSLIVKVKAHASTEREVWERIYEKLSVVWQFFRQLGWALQDEATMTFEGKKEVVGLLDEHQYEEGEEADIDDTPQPATVHYKRDGDGDRIVNMARWVSKHGDKLRELPEEIQRLRAEIRELTAAIGGGSTSPPEERRPEIR